MIEDLAEATICIIGLGLMGGSLAAALRQRHCCREVIGVARRAITLDNARAQHYIDLGYSNLAEGVRGADIVILATPVCDIIAKIGQLSALVKPGCLVMDLGSTKQDVCAALDQLPLQVEVLGGHPMCGKESSGLEEADVDLYHDKVFILCPLARTSEQALSLGRQLATAVGARPLVLQSERHDTLVAAISHLPYLLAVALVNSAEELAHRDALVWQLAASGFQGASRLAASDVTMMLDILLTNRAPILASLESAQNQLTALRSALQAQDMQTLSELLGAARTRRKELNP
jgi:prephenate dehydrogenase